MPLPIAVATISLLFLIAALCQPLAARLRLPLAVMLAIAGLALSICATWAASSLSGGPLTAVGEMAQAIQDLPISSDAFLYVLLPILLFQGAVGIDVRHLVRDGVAIILLAIVAVLLSIGMIGGAIHLASGIGLTACLLLGAIVATTDPSAVISIFRELGAPPRLTRLVEGESLLNDATAVAVFNALLAALLVGVQPDFGIMGIKLVIGFISGIAFGLVVGHALCMILDRLPSYRSAQMTLVLITPYLVYAAGVAMPLVSGVVAVVTTGITLGAVGRSRFSRGDFRFLRELLDQASDWSTGLTFVLAALLVPKILRGAGWADLGLVMIVVIAALAARAATLFVLAPLLARAGAMRPISSGMNTALLWGGLRGALTLALVLAISENPFLSPEVARTIAILATGYTLFTLLVQGTTLRRVVTGLGLTRMGPVEAAFRAQALQTAVGRARERVSQFARRSGISPKVAEAVMQPLEERLGRMSNNTTFEDAITDTEKLRLALAALVNHERNLLLEQRWSSGLPSNMIDLYLYTLDTMRDEARAGGRTGYLAAARRPYRREKSFRMMTWLHRWLRWQGPLASYLARRYHYTLVNRTIVQQLGWYIETGMSPIFGARICTILGEINARRREEINRNIDAIRLQYPHFADGLERNMLDRYAHVEEVIQIAALRDAGVITRDIATSLIAEAKALHRENAAPARVDIESPKPELLRKLRAFENLPDHELRRLARRLRPVVFSDNTVIYRPGDTVDQIYFIASGAVEVRRDGDEPRRLGRGQAFGQLRVLNPDLRPATVTSISYSHCFAMKVADFRSTLRGAPDWSGRITSESVTAIPSG